MNCCLHHYRKPYWNTRIFCFIFFAYNYSKTFKYKLWQRRTNIPRTAICLAYLSEGDNLLILINYGSRNIAVSWKSIQVLFLCETIKKEARKDFLKNYFLSFALFNHTISTAMSAGLTPLIRLAWARL